MGDQVDAGLLRILSVAVDGLFGRYSHRVELKQSDRITILHGPNGVGKTVLLRLLDSVFNGRFYEVVKIPFSSFEVTFSDQTALQIQPASSARIAVDQEVKDVMWRVTRHEPGNHQIYEFQYPEDLVEWARGAERFFPQIYRSGPATWTHTVSDETLTASDLYERFGSRLPQFKGHKRIKAREEPEWLSGIRKRVRVHFIDTHRLMQWGAEGGAEHRKSGVLIPTVNKYASDLQRRIRDVMAAYATKSQLMDQTFPQRLLKQFGSAGRTKVKLKKELSDLESRREKLQLLGLLDKSEGIPFDTREVDSIDDEQVNVLNLYVDDTEEKLDVLNDLASRLDLLTQNVNNKFKHKSLVIDREAGFIARDNDGDRPLDPERLSSGEQHEIVLLYDLLFKVSRNTLVLIDEPELSLHVLWQKRFLIDLSRIVETAKFDVMLATHSPYVVGARHDLAVQLGGEEGVD